MHRGHTESVPLQTGMMGFLSCLNHPLTEQKGLQCRGMALSVKWKTPCVSNHPEGGEARRETQGEAECRSHPPVCPAGSSRSPLSLSQDLMPIPALHKETRGPEPFPARAVSAPAWVRDHPAQRHELITLIFTHCANEII